MGLTLLIICVGLHPALAAAPQSPAAAQPSSGETSNPPAGDDDRPAGDRTAGDTPAAAAPRLQLEDEGPAAARKSNFLSAPRTVVTDAGDERPFWKSWIFWAVSGALVAGAVGLAVYTSSRTNSSLAPCPPEVQVSLGCYGAGRGP